MAEEFVDLYEIIELQIDADRNTIRKRINDLYLDAQRNLDHRNFQTRVKYQELFEITLPQARYILLDEGRRDDYDRMVRAYRAAARGGPVPAPGAPAAPTQAKPNEPDIPGTAPDIGPLPAIAVDPAQLAKEREELWSKWKTGLEAAMVKEKDSDGGKPDSAPRPTPSAAPPPRQAAAPAAAATPQPASKQRARPQINFDFDGTDKQAAAEPEADGPAPPDGHHRKPDQATIDRQRDQRRREVIKEMLVNVAMVWNGVGFASVFVPGFIILTVANGYLYPARKAPVIPALKPGLYWPIGLVILALGGMILARTLSKKMRQKTVAELSRLSYEQLMARAGK